MVKLRLFTLRKIRRDIKIQIYFPIFYHFFSIFFITIYHIRRIAWQNSRRVRNRNFSIFIYRGILFYTLRRNKTNQIYSADQQGN